MGAAGGAGERCLVDCLVARHHGLEKQTLDVGSGLYLLWHWNPLRIHSEATLLSVEIHEKAVFIY